MSGADFISVEELNPYSKINIQPDRDAAMNEHANVITALETAGIEVVKVNAPKDCQDGIYTANWALCWRGKVVLSSLPNKRRAEQPYAKQVLSALGYETIESPYHFSGQGDALPCGDYLFVGSHYRTSPKMHDFLANVYDCNVIGLETIPELDANGKPVINAVTGWPDSYFYDLDLALAVITPDLIAWCPDAFTEESRHKIASLPLQKITVSFKEAEEGFACNLVSTGETVIMSDKAPELKKAIEEHGLTTITPHITELSKGGGYIRCCSLTLCS